MHRLPSTRGERGASLRNPHPPASLLAYRVEIWMRCECGGARCERRRRCRCECEDASEESPSPSSLPTYPSSSSSPPSSPPIPHYERRRRYGWEDGSRFARLPSPCARTASRSEWGRWRCGGAHCVRSPACSGSRRPLEELGRWGVRAEMRDAPHGYGARVAVERDRW
ncbi:hypothetical protein B0H13DRAFT_2061838 [Mycena leptocephala]|nr:hypothetical protein B0H13DRAFT_2061838 [Mycena leptocephala]